MKIIIKLVSKDVPTSSGSELIYLQKQQTRLPCFQRAIGEQVENSNWV